MNPIIFLLAPVYFASYFPGSYAVLSLTGVHEQRVKRAPVFGGIIAALQVAPPILLAIIIGEASVILGSAVSLIGSYMYVAGVLTVSCYKNVAIVVFLPMLSTVIAGALYLIIFGVTE
ncbi:MAG: hypothetical protein V7459_03875 [Oceanicoccus sp.]